MSISNTHRYKHKIYKKSLFFKLFFFPNKCFLAGLLLKGEIFLVSI